MLSTVSLNDNTVSLQITAALKNNYLVQPKVTRKYNWDDKAVLCIDGILACHVLVLLSTQCFLKETRYLTIKIIVIQ